MQKLKQFESELDAEADLYSIGKAVNSDFELIDPLDSNATDEFFISLSSNEKRALEHYAEVVSVPANTVSQTVSPVIKSFDKNSLRLEDILEKYINEIQNRWQKESGKKTGAKNQAHLRLFIAVVGNVPVSTLDKSDVARFKDALLSWPKNRNKIPQYKHKTIEELYKMNIPERHRLGNSTIRDYLSNIIRFLDWCLDNDYIKSDISRPLHAAKKSLPKSKRSQDQRNVFSDDDLKNLFLSKQYLQSLHKEPSQHWIPLLAVFTGARQGELSQLYVEDVKHDLDLDIWYIDINDNDDKVIKTYNSNRQIPIHKQLIKLGFLDYKKTVRSKQLFPELIRANNGTFNIISRWFNRTYQKSCNVGLEYEEKKTFHSFRHTFLNSFKQQSLSIDIAEEIAGHAPSGSETRTRYAKSTSLELKSKELQKLNYAAIDFSKIRSWKQAVKLQSRR